MPRVAKRPARPARPAKRPGRLRLLLRRQRRHLRPLAWGGAALLVLLAGVLLLRTVPAAHNVVTWRERIGGALGRRLDLRVQDIVVEGRAMTPECLLDAALSVHPGDPMLGFSLAAARARIETLSWVQSATVERRLPGTIVVSLVERRPFAVWQNNGKFVLIDRAGQVVAEQDPAKDAEAFRVLPLFVGAGSPAHAAELLDLLAGQPALKSRVVAAIRVGERRWNLRLNTGADVMLPEGAAAAAIQRLMDMEAQASLLDRPLRVLDMRLPDRLVVRPQAEAPPPVATGPRRPT